MNFRAPINSALIVVDVQHDFLPGGALAVPDGNEVVPVVERLLPEFEHLFFTQDWHPKNHGSFAANHGVEIGSMGELSGLPQVMWPTHCVQETHGAAFAVEVPERAVIVQKGCDPKIDSYSGFFDNGRLAQTQLHALLAERNIETVYVLGLATDYCVMFTALDAVSLDFQTVLVEDGCRGVNLSHDDVDNALRKLDDAGVRQTSSEKLVQQFSPRVAS